jgi:hypothetical protein
MQWLALFQLHRNMQLNPLFTTPTTVDIRCRLHCSPFVSLKGCSSTRLSVLYFCALALLAVDRLAPPGGGSA